MTKPRSTKTPGLGNEFCACALGCARSRRRSVGSWHLFSVIALARYFKTSGPSRRHVARHQPVANTRLKCSQTGDEWIHEAETPAHATSRIVTRHGHHNTGLSVAHDHTWTPCSHIWIHLDRAFPASNIFTPARSIAHSTQRAKTSTVHLAFQLGGSCLSMLHHGLGLTCQQRMRLGRAVTGCHLFPRKGVSMW